MTNESEENNNLNFQVRRRKYNELVHMPSPKVVPIIDVKLKAFISWLARIDINYDELTEDEQCKLLFTYEESHTPPGIIHYWIPFWSRPAQSHEE